MTEASEGGRSAALPHHRVSRRRFLELAGAGGVTLFVPGIARAADAPPAAHLRSDSVVLRWNAAALQCVRESRLGPPMVARALAIAHTCIYDAWAAYDRLAVGTRLGGELRAPPSRRTLANKEKAMSVAAYRALPHGELSILPHLDHAITPLVREVALDFLLRHQ